MLNKTTPSGLNVLASTANQWIAIVPWFELQITIKHASIFFNLKDVFNFLFNSNLNYNH